MAQRHALFVRLAAVAVCAAAAALTARAQEAPLPRFTSGADMVALTVTVENLDGSFLDQLRPDDFQLFDNGEAQPIAFFDHGRVPVDVLLLVDTSLSMMPILPDVRRAANTLITALSERDRRAYRSIASELSHQYSLAYVAPRRGARKFARISVVVQRAHVSVRARSGYMTAARP